MNPLPHWLSGAGLDDPLVYVALFLGASALILWRLEALMGRGLEGTAVGTIVMPLCSGLGNLLFVLVEARQGRPGAEVCVNALVNNVTNLTLLLGLPALIWGLSLGPVAQVAGPRSSRATGKRSSEAKRPRARAANKAGGASSSVEIARRHSKLAVLLTLVAVGFFSGLTWVLATDGTLDRTDGIVLCALFAFWQCFQAYDVAKHRASQPRPISAWAGIDAALIVAGGWLMLVSLDSLVAWLGAPQHRVAWLGPQALGWITGWLMVLPNALLAFYYAARGRGEVVYASQVGDGHICIPLCLGLAALAAPVKVPPTFGMGLVLLVAAAILHAGLVATVGRLPRWLGGVAVAAYGWFVYAGLS